ncbi:hypothetical protein ACFC0M_25970 [Streptomyces sp. NPDC056149]|uniref:hypothetical protein n=1 Tax=Streptomyces sp. NPDC056149 TaxID=3345728 RepID=UPI0035DF05D5
MTKTDNEPGRVSATEASERTPDTTHTVKSVSDVVGDHAEKKAREGDERYADYGGPVAAQLRAELADVQSELSASRAKLVRYEAAEKAGIPLAHADRLKGETPEDLAADAAQLAQALAPARPLVKSRPKPLVGAGADANGDTQLDPMRLATAVIHRFKNP